MLIRFRMTVAVYLVLLILLPMSCPLEMTLSRNTTDHSPNNLAYTLPVMVEKQLFKLKVTLGDGESWIKAADCHVCNGTNCKQQCSKVLAGSAGFKCHNRKICQKLSQGVKEQEPSGEVDGDLYKVNLTNEDRQSIGATDLLIANIVQVQTARSLGKHFDGQLNLLSKATMLGGISKLSLLYPEKTPILVLGDPPTKHLLNPNEAISVDLNEDGSVSIDDVEFEGKSLSITGRSVFSIQDKELLLSAKLYSQLAAAINEGLKDCQVQLNKSRSVSIHCKEGSEQQYELLNGKQLTFVANGTKVAVPFHSLMANCKRDSCSTFLRVLPKESPYTVVFGEALLTNFAVTFDLEAASVRLTRLSNLWGKMFADKHSFWLFYMLWWLIRMLLKLIFYMSLVSLAINLYFNRRKIIKWFGRRFAGKNSASSKHSGLSYSATLSDDIDRPVLHENKHESGHRNPHSKDFWQVDEIEGI